MTAAIDVWIDVALMVAGVSFAVWLLASAINWMIDRRAVAEAARRERAAAQGRRA